mmetsp:Transcript_20674/g.48868  ORF Transcript_20674/g.48868 Transcript_20674/m.48868 type:complete len:547 (+) Transcript_20674:69-1709(+)
MYGLITLLTLPGRGGNDVVHSQNHLGSLGSAEQDTELRLEAFHHAQLGHIRHLAFVHVQTIGRLALRMGRPKLRNQLGRVVSSVVGHDRGELPQGLGEGRHGQGPLAGSRIDLPVDGLRHERFGAPAAVDRPRILHGGQEDAKRVVQAALGLVEDVARCSPQHDGAGLSRLAAPQAEDLVLANHDLLDHVALAHGDQLGMVEGAHDLPPGDGRQPLHPVEVGVLDGHDALLGEDALGQVVDELPVDEDVAPVRGDLAALGPHLVLLGLLDLGHLGHGVDADAAAVDLDLVGVHAGVGDEDLGVLDAAGLADADALVEEESLLEVRVAELPPGLLEDLDVLEVGAAPEAEDGVDGQGGEVVLLVGEELGAEGRPGDLEEDVAELGVVGRHVEGGRLEGLPGVRAGEAPPSGDGLGVDVLLGDELLGLAEQLAAEDGDRGGAVADLVVLDSGDVDQDLGGGIVEVDGPEDRGAVVGYRHRLVVFPDVLEDLVHALGTQRRLDEVGDRYRPDEGRETSILALVDVRPALEEGCLHGGAFGVRAGSKQRC